MSYFKDLLKDPYFKTGFFLQGPNPVKDQRKVFSHLDYEGEAMKVNDVLWIMSQWWTPYPFSSHTFLKKEAGDFTYENASRKCEINTNQGSFRFFLDSYKEYQELYKANRLDPHLPWSHFLLEQDFVESVKVKDLDALYANLHFIIHAVENKNGEEFDPNKHTAQFVWYITIREGKGNSKESLGGNFIWFGLPIYDFRYPYNAKHIQYDGEFEGSTRTLIYNLDSRDYLTDVPLEFGKEYSISIDILPYIHRAIRYALKEKIFTSTRNLVVNYMNIGWELPGAFTVDSEISQIQLKGVFHD